MVLISRFLRFLVRPLSRVLSVLFLICYLQYRVSPFANRRARHNSNFDSKSNSIPELVDVELKRRHRWSPVIDAAKWRKKSFFQHMELCQTLHGFIVFEVSWKDVCGINYLNELQVHAAPSCFDVFLSVVDYADNFSFSCRQILL